MGTLTADQIEDFLDKLNSDDEFRDRLVNDTGSVMDEYGIAYGPDDLVDPSDVQLPSKGEVNANRDAFRDLLFLDNEFTFNAPNFTLPRPAE